MTETQKKTRQKVQYQLMISLDEFSETTFNQIFEEGDIENIFDSIVEEIESNEIRQRNGISFIAQLVQLLTQQKILIEEKGQNFSEFLLKQNRQEANKHIKKAMKIPSLKKSTDQHRSAVKETASSAFLMSIA